MTAEMASSYRRLLRQTKIFPYWEYTTARDERVREAHRLLDGVTLPWNDPRWKKIYPPNGWRCRCIVVGRTRNQARNISTAEMQERVDKYFETADWKKEKAQGWGVNRALVGEVFTQNQFYIRKFQDKAAKLLGDLHYNDWGLDSFGKRLAAATQEMPVYKGTAEEWYARNSVLEDYKGRKVVMDKDVFKRHTTGSHATRVELLDAVPDILKNPDEVWMNNYMDAFRNLNFIRFYKGQVLNVVCEVTDMLEYHVTTWFDIYQGDQKRKDSDPRSRRAKKNDTPRWKYRRGLLIKK